MAVPPMPIYFLLTRFAFDASHIMNRLLFGSHIGRVLDISGFRPRVKPAHGRHAVQTDLTGWQSGSREKLPGAARSIRDRISVDHTLNRKTVSYQANKSVPGLRWMRYKEGFSAELAKRLLEQTDSRAVLDPFSGIGTTALVASGLGMKSVGIDVMPVGNTMALAVMSAANDVDAIQLSAAFSALQDHLKRGTGMEPLGHVNITRNAYPPDTEAALARARWFIGRVKDPNLRLILKFACMSVLERISYTIKDGQFLRWDGHSGRLVAGKLNKGKLPTLARALSDLAGIMLADVPHIRNAFGGPRPDIRTGSCLTTLRGLRAGSFDTVLTSPPYANRYDYTRIYALELAWLGYDQKGFCSLRQEMLSATVENRPKRSLLEAAYGKSTMPATSYGMAAGNKTLRQILGSLNAEREHLNNPHIVRLVENYFAEMALVISELGRLVRPEGDVFIVNDNVRYHGIDIPVDIILSEFAEESGFRCESIRTLRRGKGNSSQQMGRFGRRELRKCVYHWKRRRPA